MNDSKGTNVGETVAAVEGLAGPGKIVLIAGGDGKGADFSPLAPALAHRARAAVLLGRDGPALRDAIEDVTPTYRAESMEEAVSIASRVARPDDVVLLSPACASWDMYPSYVKRGEHFVACVRALEAGVSVVPSCAGAAR